INHAYQHPSAVFPLAGASTYQDMFTSSESSPKLVGEMENAHSLKSNDNINDRQDNGIHHDGVSGHMITNNGSVQTPYHSSQLADNINPMTQLSSYYFETDSSANPFEVSQNNSLKTNFFQIFQAIQSHSEAQNAKETEPQSQQVAQASPSKSNT
ncbi:5684_t:CDS:2, partial [Acaulospora colombiana]